jgi:hypothetical protein
MAVRSAAVLPIMTTRLKMIIPVLAGGWLVFLFWIVCLCRAAARQEPSLEESEEALEIGA